MRFFKYFPRTIESNGIIITNIFKKIVITQGLKDASAIYYSYYIKDGERLDTIAKKRYGGEEFQWVIMMINNMMDPREDTPLGHREFNDLMIDLYGSVENAQVGIHHYENEDGVVVDEEYPYVKIPISFYEYEDRINESKREIKLIRPEYISVFEEELRRVFV